MARCALLIVCLAPLVWESGSMGNLSQCFQFDRDKALYLGNASEANDGQRCMRWKDAPKNSLQKFSFILQENYCRDGNGLGYPWCYVKKDSPQRLKCNVPSCPDPQVDEQVPVLEKCFFYNAIKQSALYDGTVATTVSGRSCQKWSDKTSTLFLSVGFLLNLGTRDEAGLSNYCRDPLQKGHPWCYTTDPLVPWEWCSVDLCPLAGRNDRLANLTDCYVTSSKDGMSHALYFGTMSGTVSGKNCLKWDHPALRIFSTFTANVWFFNQDHNNFCRDFDASGRPWCFTSLNRSREACPVPSCNSPQYIMTQRVSFFQSSKRDNEKTTLSKQTESSTQGRQVSIPPCGEESSIQDGLTSDVYFFQSSKRDKEETTVSKQTESSTQGRQVSIPPGGEESSIQDGLTSDADVLPISHVISASVSCVVILVIAAAAAVLCRRRLESRRSEARTRKRRGLHGVHGPWLCEGVDLFPESKLRLGEALGKGNFGVVLKAEALGLLVKGAWNPIAVKTWVGSASASQRREFLDEILLMKSLTPHANVIAYLGASQGPTSGCLMLLMELAPGGSLIAWLRRQRSSVAVEDEALERAKLLLSFSLQVARGMAHLASQRIVHRDLAARNVLLGGDRVCKISDFGMARKLEDGSDGYKTLQGPVPLRWMAPESLRDRSHSTQSDVWSYGVTVWEMLTLGATPFHNLEINEVTASILKGKLLDKPDSCNQDLFDVVTTCWRLQPEQRPSFATLAILLDVLLAQSSDYIQLTELKPDLYLVVENVSEDELM